MNFAVRSGECVVLSGPSGAGKSSILKMIYGNYRADRGAILVRDGDEFGRHRAGGTAPDPGAPPLGHRLCQPVPARHPAGRNPRRGGGGRGGGRTSPDEARERAADLLDPLADSAAVVAIAAGDLLRRRAAARQHRARPRRRKADPASRRADRVARRRQPGGRGRSRQGAGAVGRRGDRHLPRRGRARSARRPARRRHALCAGNGPPEGTGR